MRRVAVTGLGAITPIGLDAPSTWQSAVAGERDRLHRGLRRERVPGPDRRRGEGFDATRSHRRRGRRMDRNVLLALGAAQEAWREGGLNGIDPARVGIVVGSAIGGLPGIVEQQNVLRDRGPDRFAVLHPERARRLGERPDRDLARPARPQLRARLRLRDRLHAVGEGAELIRRRRRRRLAGGTESCIHPLILAGFCAMRGLVAEDEDPTKASRPFDATRAGFVMSEAACILLLEELESAQARRDDLRRGARLRRLNDAHHMAQPEPEATGVAGMMRARSSARASSRSGSATSTRTAPRRRSATRPRRGRSSRSSATTPTSSPSPRRSRSPATASGPPARSSR